MWFFHAHVYFDASQVDEASQLREKALAEIGTLVRASRLIDRPIGPHPVGMFEMDFSEGDFQKVVPWILRHHGSLDVLVHPLSGDELADHTAYAMWIGQQLKLDLSVLK